MPPKPKAISKSHTQTHTDSRTASKTRTHTRTSTKSNTKSPSRSPTAIKTHTHSSTKTATRTPSNTATKTYNKTSSKSKTHTKSLTNTHTPTKTSTKSNTKSPSRSPTAIKTHTHSSTKTATRTSSNTGTKTYNNTLSKSITHTKSLTNTHTPTKSETKTPTAGKIHIGSITKTSTHTPTHTFAKTFTESPTKSKTSSLTRTTTNNYTKTPTRTRTNSLSGYSSRTHTDTKSLTNTKTITVGTTQTDTSTSSLITNTPTRTRTNSLSGYTSRTPTDTKSLTNTKTITVGTTQTDTSTSSLINTKTNTASPSKSETSTTTSVKTLSGTTLTNTGSASRASTNTYTDSKTYSLTNSSTKTLTLNQTKSKTRSFSSTNTHEGSLTNTINETGSAADSLLTSRTFSNSPSLNNSSLMNTNKPKSISATQIESLATKTGTTPLIKTHTMPSRNISYAFATVLPTLPCTHIVFPDACSKAASCIFPIALMPEAKIEENFKICSVVLNNKKNSALGYTSNVLSVVPFDDTHCNDIVYKSYADSIYISYNFSTFANKTGSQIKLISFVTNNLALPNSNMNARCDSFAGNVKRNDNTNLDQAMLEDSTVFKGGTFYILESNTTQSIPVYENATGIFLVSQSYSIRQPNRLNLITPINKICQQQSCINTLYSGSKIRMVPYFTASSVKPVTYAFATMLPTIPCEPLPSSLTCGDSKSCVFPVAVMPELDVETNFRICNVVLNKQKYPILGYTSNVLTAKQFDETACNRITFRNYAQSVYKSTVFASYSNKTGAQIKLMSFSSLSSGTAVSTCKSFIDTVRRNDNSKLERAMLEDNTVFNNGTFYLLEQSCGNAIPIYENATGIFLVSVDYTKNQADRQSLIYPIKKVCQNSSCVKVDYNGYKINMVPSLVRAPSDCPTQEHSITHTALETVNTFVPLPNATNTTVTQTSTPNDLLSTQLGLRLSATSTIPDGMQVDTLYAFSYILSNMVCAPADLSLECVGNELNIFPIILLPKLGVREHMKVCSSLIYGASPLVAAPFYDENCTHIDFINYSGSGYESSNYSSYNNITRAQIMLASFAINGLIFPPGEVETTCTSFASSKLRNNNAKLEKGMLEDSSTFSRGSFYLLEDRGVGDQSIAIYENETGAFVIFQDYNMEKPDRINSIVSPNILCHYNNCINVSFNNKIIKMLPIALEIGYGFGAFLSFLNCGSNLWNSNSILEEQYILPFGLFPTKCIEKNFKVCNVAFDGVNNTAIGFTSISLVPTAFGDSACNNLVTFQDYRGSGYESSNFNSYSNITGAQIKIMSFFLEDMRLINDTDTTCESFSDNTPAPLEPNSDIENMMLLNNTMFHGGKFYLLDRKIEPNIGQRESVILYENNTGVFLVRADGDNADIISVADICMNGFITCIGASYNGHTISVVL